jgi:hypothetical protein
MFRLILIGVWACFATLATTYAAFYYRSHPSHGSTSVPQAQTKPRDLKTITVPIIQDSQILGYISAEFSIIAPPSDPHQQTPDADGYVLDEAYRLIYSEAKIDFEHIQKTDLDRLTSDIKSHVNSRLRRAAIEDVLVRSFHYVPRDHLDK